MLTGLDLSAWSTVTDWNAMINDQTPVDIVYIRAHDGYRDDSKFPAFRKELVKVRNPNGSVLWGPYIFIGYSATVGSLNWKAVRGDYQAQNGWDLATAGGREFQLPAAIDLEQITFFDGGVRQQVPLPAPVTYLEQYVLPAISFLTAQQGRRPVLYSSPNFLLNYLGITLLSRPEYKPVLECPLWLAAWTKSGEPPYFRDVKLSDGSIKRGVINLWPQYLIHQYTGDTKDWPGTDDVDLNRCPGTRGQWKAWLADSSKPMPSETLPDPGEPPTEPPPPPPPPGTDLSGVNLRLDDLIARVNNVQGTLNRIYK